MTGVDTVNAFFEAFGARDIDRLLSLITPDATWTIPGDPALVPWVGRRTGHNEIRAFFTELFKAAEPLAFEVQSMTEVGDQVLIPGRFVYRFQPSGQVLDDEFVMRFTVTGDGRVRAYQIFEDSLTLARVYLGEGEPVISAT
jgi:uncharacterized protein